MEQLKWNELKGRAVIDITTAKRVGSVDDLVLDGQTYQIVGLKFKPGLFNATKTVPVNLIKGIGDDAVTLQLEQESPPASSDQPAPQNLPALSQIIGNGVVTEGGKHIGEISNVCLSWQPLAITGYEISKGGIFSKTHTFEITSAVHYGEKLVIIPDSLLDAFTPSSENTDEPTKELK
jgi:sporulation protein YlmC with PRC-barrel domain